MYLKRCERDCIRAATAFDNREIKFDVAWSYVKRQTAKMTSEFVFFSSNPSLNHIKIEKCLLLFATNANIFTLLFKELETDGKSFIFAVCRLTYDHVTSNLISLIFNKQLHCQITVHRCKLDCYFIVLILVYRNFCTVNAAT